MKHVKYFFAHFFHSWETSSHFCNAWWANSKITLYECSGQFVQVMCRGIHKNPLCRACRVLSHMPLQCVLTECWHVVLRCGHHSYKEHIGLLVFWTVVTGEDWQRVIRLTCIQCRWGHLLLYKDVQGAAKKDPSTRTSVSSKWRNSFVCNFQQLLKRKFATGRTSFVQYYESLRNWSDF